jgi:hypothetical protein
MAAVTGATGADKDGPDTGRRRFLLLSAGEPAAAPPPAEPPAADHAATVSAMAEHIRQCTRRGCLARRHDFAEPPFALAEDGLAAALDALVADPDCADIVTLHGDKDDYHYSTERMTANYARILFWLAERDTRQIVAETVRFECATYPRPYPVRMLMLQPYFFDDARIAAALAMLAQSDAHRDIKRVQASNGALYLYSEQTMSEPEAEGLCEWLEVEQHANP